MYGFQPVFRVCGWPTGLEFLGQWNSVDSAKFSNVRDLHSAELVAGNGSTVPVSVPKLPSYLPRMPEPDHPEVIAPPVAIHVAFVLLGAAAESLWPSGAGQGRIAGYATGAAAIAAGLLAIVWAGMVFRSRGTRPEPWKPSTAVVDSGPYRFSRNPMYLALGVIHLGVGIAVGSIWIIATLVPTLVVMRYGVIGREERYLEAKFGDTYLRYKLAVRRWL